MAKTFPIRLEVEEIALGSVLRRLHDMPGIAKLDLDLGHGGNGKGREQLQSAAAAMRGEGIEQSIITQLMAGPKSNKELRDILQVSAHKLSYHLTKMRKQKVIKSDGHGRQQIGPALIMEMKAPAIALPAPQIKRGPSGRASPGSGPILLRSALDGGPLQGPDLYAKMTAGGLSSKAVSGVLRRGKVDGIIKRNGKGYELTAKGRHMEVNANG
jgi:hypothetical protein